MEAAGATSRYPQARGLQARRGLQTPHGSLSRGEPLGKRLPGKSGRSLHFSEHQQLELTGRLELHPPSPKPHLGAKVRLSKKNGSSHDLLSSSGLLPPSGRPGVSLVDEVREPRAGAGLRGHKCCCRGPLPLAWEPVRTWLTRPLSGDPAWGRQSPTGSLVHTSGLWPGWGEGHWDLVPSPLEHLGAAVCILPQHLARR